MKKKKIIFVCYGKMKELEIVQNVQLFNLRNKKIKFISIINHKVNIG